MQQMFSRTSDFNQPIGNWDTSNVTNMNGMFFYADAFNQPIGNWDTSKVVTMNAMFYYAKKFNQDISQWDVSNVTNMRNMFFYCEHFNQPISKWNVSSVQNMDSMFWGCRKFNQDIRSWNVSRVQFMKEIFMDCPLETIQHFEFMPKMNPVSYTEANIEKIKKGETHDIITLTDVNVQTFLEEDKNNIVFVYKNKNNTKYYSTNKTNLKRVYEDKNKICYECNEKNDENTLMPYFYLNTIGIILGFVPYGYIKQIIEDTTNKTQLFEIPSKPLKEIVSYTSLGSDDCKSNHVHVYDINEIIV
jgi:surface protein